MKSNGTLTKVVGPPFGVSRSCRPLVTQEQFDEEYTFEQRKARDEAEALAKPKPRSAQTGLASRANSANTCANTSFCGPWVGRHR